MINLLSFNVVVGGKLFGKGKNLEKFLAEARRKYPEEAPLVTKVPQRGTLYLGKSGDNDWETEIAG